MNEKPSFFAELKRRNVYNDPLRNDPRFQKLVAAPAPKGADK